MVSRIELPEVNDDSGVALTPEQVAAPAVAMRKSEPRYEVLVWFGACAGLRAGEALGLTRTRVGWQEDRCTFKSSASAAKPHRSKPKPVTRRCLWIIS
ncbi:hypothetical protein ACIO93_33615 [Streptomyces sp. NPDC087903]|uniref:hypothetical protein n=1 Tax=Streptomyces sp. NPDC087903 TaxID=3365819 RepID=UPI0038113704